MDIALKTLSGADELGKADPKDRIAGAMLHR